MENLDCEELIKTFEENRKEKEVRSHSSQCSPAQRNMKANFRKKKGINVAFLGF